MRAMSFNWIKLSVCVRVRALWMFVVLVTRVSVSVMYRTL